MKTTSANIPSVIDVRKRRASGYASPSRTESERLATRPIPWPIACWCCEVNTTAAPTSTSPCTTNTKMSTDMPSAIATGTATTAHTITAAPIPVFTDVFLKLAREHRPDTHEDRDRSEQQRQER